jgi:hypothetical protein
VIVHEFLHGRDQVIKVHAQWRLGAIEAGYLGHAIAIRQVVRGRM